MTGVVPGSEQSAHRLLGHRRACGQVGPVAGAQPGQARAVPAARRQPGHGVVLDQALARFRARVTGRGVPGQVPVPAPADRRDSDITMASPPDPTTERQHRAHPMGARKGTPTAPGATSEASAHLLCGCAGPPRSTGPVAGRATRPSRARSTTYLRSRIGSRSTDSTHLCVRVCSQIDQPAARGLGTSKRSESLGILVTCRRECGGDGGGWRSGAVSIGAWVSWARVGQASSRDLTCVRACSRPV